MRKSSDQRRKLLARTRRRWRREQRPKVYLEKEADFFAIHFRNGGKCLVCGARSAVAMYLAFEGTPNLNECVKCGAVVTERDWISFFRAGR